MSEHLFFYKKSTDELEVYSNERGVKETKKRMEVQVNGKPEKYYWFYIKTIPGKDLNLSDVLKDKIFLTEADVKL